MEPTVAGIPSNILASEEYRKIGFSMHQFAHYAIQQTRKLASTLLKTRMLSQRSESEVQYVVDKLITREHYPSHGSVINHEEAKQLGLKISYLEDNSSLWKKIWLLYCMYVFDSNARELSKIFEQRTFSHAILGPDPLDEEASSSK
jgi:hypothetical protein